MNLSKKLITATLVLPMFLGSIAYADGHQGDKERHAKKGHGACGEAALMHQLSLSDAQKSEIKALRSANREQMKDYFEQNGEAMMAARKAQHTQMQKLVMADKFDQGTANKLAEEMSAKHASMMVKKLEHEHKLVSVLTPEQKAQYAKLKQEQQQACQGDRGHRKGGHGDKGHSMDKERS